MFQVNHLTITHWKDLTTLVDDLSFTLTAGDRAALIGEEGNGKSTLLKLLYHPSLISSFADWSGEVNVKGTRRGYLAQELSPEALAMPARDFCESYPAFNTANPKELSQLCAKLGLDSSLFYDWRSMDTLSGGERVKLRLALMMLEQPDVLLLDEPSNDLDLNTLAWLETFLLECGVPVLYVSHDERLLERTANLIIHLERLDRRRQPRATVARSSYRDYVEGRGAAFARQERIARKEREQFDDKVERYRRIRDKVEHAQASISRQDPHGGRLLKKKMHTVQSLGRRLEQERDSLTPMPHWEQAILTAFNEARASLPTGKAVLRLELPALAVEGRTLATNVRLWVTGPERVGIVGSNGVGKTTLLKRIADELLPRQDIRAAYMPQNYDESLLRDKTPIALLAPSGRREDITRARTYLGAMQYKTEEMEHSAAELSGGQRAKLLYLGMVLQGANVLLLDEPTRNFSPMSAKVIREALAGFPGCIISVSHDRAYLEQVCTRVVELMPQGLRER